MLRSMSVTLTVLTAKFRLDFTRPVGVSTQVKES